jgi:hypothetical protein
MPALERSSTNQEVAAPEHKEAFAWTSRGSPLSWQVQERVEPMDPQIDVALRELLRKQWLWIQTRADDYPHLPELVDAGAPFQQLLVLFPFLSVGRLCFSRCTEFPYYVDFLVQFWERRYSAHATLERGGWVHTRSLGCGSAGECLAIVAAHIPPGYGPARVGNANVLFPGSD